MNETKNKDGEQRPQINDQVWGTLVITHGEDAGIYHLYGIVTGVVDRDNVTLLFEDFEFMGDVKFDDEVAGWMNKEIHRYAGEMEWDTIHKLWTLPL